MFGSPRAPPQVCLSKPQPASGRWDQHRADARSPPLGGKQPGQRLRLVQRARLDRDVDQHGHRERQSGRAMAMTVFFDYLRMRLNGANAGDRCSTIVCVLPDLDETWTVTLGHGTLSHRKGADSNPEATLTIKRSDLGQVILGSRPLTEQLKGGQARIEEDVQGAARPNRPARQLRVLVRHRHALTKRHLAD
jgi:hypothetical protein